VIIPYEVVIGTSNTPQKVFASASTGSNVLLYNLVNAGNTLTAFNLSPPTTPFALGGLSIWADTACIVNFGLWNGVNFYTLYTCVATKTQYNGVRESWVNGPPLYVPQENSYVPAFQLSTAPGANVTLYGALEILATYAARTNTIT
jgi:hypothetical protein